MRSLPGSLLGLLITSLSLSGCPTCPQPPPSTCPLMSFGDHDAGPGDGQIDWSYRGKTGSLAFSSMIGQRMSCSAHLTIGTDATDGGPPPSGAILSVSCLTTDMPNVDF